MRSSGHSAGLPPPRETNSLAKLSRLAVPPVQPSIAWRMPTEDSSSGLGIAHSALILLTVWT
jgi:hypothetical protein